MNLRQFAVLRHKADWELYQQTVIGVCNQKHREDKAAGREASSNLVVTLLCEDPVSFPCLASAMLLSQKPLDVDPKISARVDATIASLQDNKEKSDCRIIFVNCCFVYSTAANLLHARSVGSASDANGSLAKTDLKSNAFNLQTDRPTEEINFKDQPCGEGSPLAEENSVKSSFSTSLPGFASTDRVFLLTVIAELFSIGALKLDRFQATYSEVNQFLTSYKDAASTGVASNTNWMQKFFEEVCGT